MIKLFSLLLTITILTSSSLFAKVWIVPPTSLTQKVSAYIKSTYPDAQIWKVERKFKKKRGEVFDVNLSNGASLKFLVNGECIDINGRYNTVPLSALPQAVANTVKNTYPQAIIVKVKKEFYGYNLNAVNGYGNYKIKLNNMMELFITADGQLIGQKYKH
ncbi:PepSY-like domain-containing protein [Brachyspira aalborgi]|mgnify:FL=1|uniref:Putative beta-lactamase-inhibitor-like PepSY-like domain-containing protein n=1 Tax=Brachyspira aalborgi TaxID=29522 RepID=A0A5C8EP46_9SPIR|nr:PepSY-like domain-containing protein [Brachyspira aalborgi]TXJ39625.1 hypothetical protein EPJ81_03965 [Brachyspira aalborgi]